MSETTLERGTGQVPDTKLGDYYVSVVDGRRFALALGPFRNDHAGALARVADVRRWCHEQDGGARSWFWAFGTCRLPIGEGRPGKLNEALGGLEPAAASSRDG